MGREIKFRYWNGNRMLKIKSIDFNYDSLEDETSHISDIENIESSKLIMQYVGLKDKNSVEIYEGDIVKCIFSTWSKDKTRYENYEEIGEVFYAEFMTSYFIRSSEDSYIDLKLGELTANCEVIGNIYENKDLIKNV